MIETAIKASAAYIKKAHNPTTPPNLSGLNVTVVGGTGGLGRAISREFASQGANVTVVGQTFRDSDVSGIKFIKADLSLMSEADRVAKSLEAEKANIVVYTTGIFAASQRQVTGEGIERDMAVSYLSRVVLNKEIAPKLNKSADGKKPRVFIMGYPGAGQLGTNLDDLNAEKAYSGMAVHMNTVAGNEMLVYDSMTRYPHINYYGLNPGLIKTNIRDNFLGGGSILSNIVEFLIALFTPTPEAYAKKIVPLLISNELEEFSGLIFDQSGEKMAPSKGLTDEQITKFLKASEELLASKTNIKK